MLQAHRARIDDPIEPGSLGLEKLQLAATPVAQKAIPPQARQLVVVHTESLAPVLHADQRPTLSTDSA